jgi:hypothetical protein
MASGKCAFLDLAACHSIKGGHFEFIEYNQYIHPVTFFYRFAKYRDQNDTRDADRCR